MPSFKEIFQKLNITPEHLEENVVTIHSTLDKVASDEPNSTLGHRTLEPQVKFAEIIKTSGMSLDGSLEPEYRLLLTYPDNVRIYPLPLELAYKNVEDLRDCCKNFPHEKDKTIINKAIDDYLNMPHTQKHFSSNLKK